MQTKTHSQTDGQARAQLEQLQHLTETYAKFSRSAAGLGNVVGAVMCLLIFLGAGLFDLSFPFRVAIGLSPIVWIVLKELLKRRYYQRFGRVSARTNASERAWHIGLTAFVSLVSLAVSLFVLNSVALRWSEAPLVTLLGILGYLAWMISLPVLVWFFMRGTEEWFVGAMLIYQAAVILAGSSYELVWSNLYIPFLLLYGLLAGVVQHREYRQLERSFTEHNLQSQRA